ncbi:MAG: glycosyltransferase family 4 protein [Bacteroidales bacterium]|nr:glycosyltransferase family 4 protein [Candidatus Latescibacterota bacterium]
MKICAFGRALPDHGIGGMERHFQVVIRGLAARGHKVTVLTTACPGRTEKRNEENISMHFLSGTIPGRYEFGYWKRSSEKFFALHRVDPFDVVFSESSGAFGYIEKKGREKVSVPVLFIAHGTPMREFRQHGLKSLFSPWDLMRMGRSLVYHRRMKKFLRHVDLVGTVSRQIAADIKSELDVADNMLRIIPNGVDIDMYRPDVEAGERVRQKSGISLDAPLIACIGRLHKDKGIGHMIEALARIREKLDGVKLMIVGDGPDGKRLRRLSAERGLDDCVIFAGVVSSEETYAYYNSCDLLALPTTAIEGLSLSLLEGMSCGKPVLSSDIGGTSELVRSGIDGILVKPRDVSGFVQAALRILEDSSLAARMGTNARDRIISGYSQEKMLDGIEGLLREIIER